MANTIFVSPPELRSKAQQLRDHAKAILSAAESTDQQLATLNSDQFSGVRADQLRSRYQSTRELLLAFDDKIIAFANQLDGAANSFEEADNKETEYSTGEGPGSAQRLENIQLRIHDLQGQYHNKLAELYEILNQATEENKEFVGGSAKILYTALKIYLGGGGVTIEDLFSVIEDSYGAIDSAVQAGELSGQATQLGDELMLIGAEINKEEYAQAYELYDGKDGMYLVEEQQVLKTRLEDEKALQADLENLVTSFDGRTSLIIGELTGITDMDQMTINYVQSMQRQRQIEMEMAAVTKRLTELKPVD